MRVGASSASPMVTLPSSTWGKGASQVTVIGDDAADQRIAVGMKARGGEADNRVARADIGTRENAVALDGADGEAREIVIAGRVHARHLGRLAADQGAVRLAAAFGDAGDDGGGFRDVELAGGEVVEEEEGLGALHDEVVDRHGDKVDADRVMDAGFDGDLQLGADAIIGGDQHRVLEPCRLEVEEAAEAAQFRVGAGPAGRFRQRRDGPDERVARVDVDPGLGVGVAVRAVLAGALGHGRKGSVRGESLGHKTPEIVFPRKALRAEKERRRKNDLSPLRVARAIL